MCLGQVLSTDPLLHRPQSAPFDPTLDVFNILEVYDDACSKDLGHDGIYIEPPPA